MVWGGGICFIWMFLCRRVKAKHCKDMVFDISCVGGAVSVA